MIVALRSSPTIHDLYTYIAIARKDWYDVYSNIRPFQLIANNIEPARLLGREVVYSGVLSWTCIEYVIAVRVNIRGSLVYTISSILRYSCERLSVALSHTLIITGI